MNPHHPKDKSYYPLTANLSQTGQLLAVPNRTGNVHDSEDALDLLSFLASDLHEKLGRRCLEVRLDGAFFRREIVEFLNAAGIDYAIRRVLSIRDEQEGRTEGAVGFHGGS